MFKAVIIGTAVALSTLFFSTVTIIVSFFQKTGNITHWVARYWAHTILFISRVKVKLEGLENIDIGTTYIYMANHQSMYDIPALLGHLPCQFRWLAKIELFRIPVFGYALSRAGYIGIDRSNRREAFKSIDRAATKVREGTSIVIFPEGSRSNDGDVKPFKKGGFVLALKSQCPIVPVTIQGSRSIVPKGSLRIKSGKILVRIHPPIKPTDFTGNTIDKLMESVRAVISDDMERHDRKSD